MVAKSIASKQTISPYYDPEYERRQFMGTVASDNYGEADWIDPLDPKLLRLLRGIIPYEEVIFTNKPITGYSHDSYYNTTLWWLILMFNGYLHAGDIPDGTRLKIPSLPYIRSKLDVSENTGRGKIVTI